MEISVITITITVYILYFVSSIVKIPRLKAKAQTKEMLERLQLVPKGYVDEHALDCDCVVALDQHYYFFLNFIIIIITIIIIMQIANTRTVSYMHLPTSNIYVGYGIRNNHEIPNPDPDQNQNLNTSS